MDMKTRELIEQLQQLIAEKPDSAELPIKISTMEYDLDISRVHRESIEITALKSVDVIQLSADE
jgi:hypothetical protein